MVSNVVAGACGVVLLLGGLAVLQECHRFEASWRSATAAALCTAGALLLGVVMQGGRVPLLAAAVAACACVPVARLLVSRRPGRRPVDRRITDLGMLAAPAPAPARERRGGMRTWVVALLAALGLLCLPLLLLTPRTAHAQAARPAMCLPERVAGAWEGGPLHTGAAGQCVWSWYVCFKVGGDVREAPQTQLVVNVGLAEQLHLVGGRVQTIMRASDPLASLNTLGQRVKMTPVTDPALAPCYEAALAHERRVTGW